MKKTLISLLALGTMITTANAACTATACTGQITKIYMTNTGTLYVGTDGDERALNCAGGPGNGGVSGVYMSLKEGDVGKNAMYSLLLTAKTTGKPVTIRIQDGSADCRVLYISD
jgi:hypothetical protein